MSILTLDLSPVGYLTDDAFYELVKANPEMKFERTASGEHHILIAKYRHSEQNLIKP